MKAISRRILVATSLISAAVPCFGAWYETIATGYWDDTSTWKSGAIPGIDPYVLDTASIKGGNVVTADETTGEITLFDLRIEGASGGLNVNGANIFMRANSTGAGPLWRGVMDATGPGEFILDSGSITIASGSAYAGTMTIASAMGASSSVTGTFSQNGGALYVNGMISIAASVKGNTTYTASGTYNLAGGALYLHNWTTTTSINAGSKYVGWMCGFESQRNSSVGSFNWTGGIFSANYVREGLNNTGTGKLTFDSLTWNTDSSDEYANFSKLEGMNRIGRMAITDFELIGGNVSSVMNNITYTQGANASMEIDVIGAGEGQYDQLRWIGGKLDTPTEESPAGGIVNLHAGTTIEVNLLDGWDLEVGDKLAIILAGAEINIIDGDISSIVLAGTHGQYFSLSQGEEVITTNSYGDLIAGTTMYGTADSIVADAIYLTFNGIPEPAASAALLGLVVLGFGIRRRR